MALLAMSSHSSVDRVPACCSGGHGFDSCWDSDLFSLSHGHVMLISSVFTYKFLVDYLGSHPPTGQTMSDRITESSVIPPRENSLDLLPVRHYGCYEHSIAIEITALIFFAFRY